MRGSGVLLVCLGLFLVGCGGGGSSSPSAPSPVPAPGSSSGPGLTGQWIGHDATTTITWTLTQSGSTVTGTSAFTEPGARGSGTVSGTVSGTTFRFRDEYPSISDGTSRGCSAVTAGDLTMSGASMAGAYSGTNSCTGAFSGQVTFTKQ